MTILALDLGTKKTGIAISHGEMAETLKTYFFDRTGIDGLIERLERIVKEQGVTQLVVGLPVGYNDEETKQSQLVRAQAEKIAQALNVKLDFSPEILTSWEAAESGASKAEVDAVAAKIILEQYINERRS